MPERPFEECPTCGAPVVVHSDDDGTSYYQPAPLTSDERAELQLLRDLRARVIGFGGDDYTIMSWEDTHRIHERKGEPYIGCCFFRDEFVRKSAEPDYAGHRGNATPPWGDSWVERRVKPGERERTD